MTFYLKKDKFLFCFATVKDGYHELHVYKIDKKFDMSNPTYLDLPSIKHNLSPKVQKHSLEHRSYNR